MEREIDMVDSSVSAIDDITHVNSEGLIAGEQRRVPRDVLLHRPYSAGVPRLGGAAPENFDAADPNPEDPVELPPFARRRPLENDLREVLSRAIRRRFEVGENRRLAVGVGEVMLEE